MKKSIVFILILCSSLKMAACGFYPYGEDIRFCFFHAFVDSYHDARNYGVFNYTTSYFYEEPPQEYDDATYDYQNTALWVKYCGQKVPKESVYEAVYVLRPTNINPKSDNKMIQFLYQKKDYDALNYLLFAKQSEIFNEYFEDPWERSESAVSPQRKGWIDLALQKCARAKSEDIKMRYRFLAIRMAYYNADSDKVVQIFDTYFTKVKTKNILYYWSLYFRTLNEKDPVLQRYYAALVFANAPDKRARIAMRFANDSIRNATLELAKSSLERANIWELDGMQRTDYAFENLKQIYINNPKSEALPFLVMREINKMEDWILTPYYSYFNPALRDEYFSDNYEEQTTRVILNRSEDDRKYAAKILNFVNNVNLSKVSDPIMIETAKAYLLFLTRDYDLCLKKVRQLEKIKSGNENLGNQLQSIKALALTAQQARGKAVIPEEIKSFLMGDYARQDTKLVFAVGRELEYLGNTTDAALLYSVANDVAWKSENRRSPFYNDYYDDSFNYIDGTYTPDQLSEVIKTIENNTAEDVFTTWKFSVLKPRLAELYDLLGTKYIRLNQLHSALAIFKKHEKMTNPATLASNPFYEIPYTFQFIERRDSIVLTKAGITEKLIGYIRKSHNAKNRDRDYYSFLVATCYLNMNYQGNAYGMRRSDWSTDESDSGLPDEAEYHGNLLARKYYLQAMRQAKTKKFKMLCLRMAARCEKFRLKYQFEQYPYNDQSKMDYDSLLNSNRYYQRLVRNYPDYDDLSFCVSFPEYFKARR
jgi:hypothetical protein